MFAQRVRAALVAAVVGLGVGSAAKAAVYNDVTGEQFSEFQHLDISSVEVTNTGTHLTFKVNLTGNIQATDWGKYMIGIDSAAGGSSNSNGWGRPISMPGMDYWIGTWADGGGGAELRHFVGTDWVLEKASYNGNLAGPALAPNSTTITVPLADLGLTVGSEFKFDVYSAGGGGGDSANDALGNSAQTISDWPNPYNSGTNVVSFTVVPEPGTLSAIGLAGLALLGRRRK